MHIHFILVNDMTFHSIPSEMYLNLRRSSFFRVKKAYYNMTSLFPFV